MLRRPEILILALLGGCGAPGPAPVDAGADLAVDLAVAPDLARVDLVPAPDLTTLNPAPVLSAIVPALAPVGGAGFPLALSGSSFLASSTVTATPSGGAPVALATRFGDASSLNADVPASLLGAPGAIAIAVVTPAPGGGTSAPQTLTVSACSGTPILTAITPAQALVGSTVMLAASGGCFDCGAMNATLTVDGAPVATTLGTCSAGLAQSASASLSGLAAGTHAIAVQDPAGTTSQPLDLTILNPQPVVTQVTASSTGTCGVVAGATAFTLTVGGSGFVAGATLTLSNGTTQFPVSVGSLGPTQITAQVTIASEPPGGYADVTVTNPSPSVGTGSGVLGVATQPTVLADVRANVFTPSCGLSNCHLGPGSSLPESMPLDPSSSPIAELVGVPAEDCPGRIRVTACDPRRTSSYLIDKIFSGAPPGACDNAIGAAGEVMPPDNSLTAAQRQMLVDWVALGAM